MNMLAITYDRVYTLIKVYVYTITKLHYICINHIINCSHIYMHTNKVYNVNVM